MKTPESGKNRNLPVYDVDLMYQDEMLDVLDKTPIDSTLALRYVDIKSIAEILLEKANSDNKTFLSEQMRLLYGSPGNYEHFRPNPTESATMIDFLNTSGFETQHIENEKLDSMPDVIIATKKQHIDIPKLEVVESGLPIYASNLYLGSVATHETTTQLRDIQTVFPEPRILNIGSGGSIEGQIPNVVNVDVSSVGKPDIVSSASRLPFPDNSFTVVMASHVLEHILPTELEAVLDEWTRVLHPKGLLRIAVPDAEKALNELISGKTHKGYPSYSVPGGSAPLTQLMGLGAEHSKTDPRWRHQILFSKKMLSDLMKKYNLNSISEYREDQALSYIAGIKNDETNNYSFRMEAIATRKPHKVTIKIDEPDYILMKGEYQNKLIEPLTTIIPIKDEEDNLPNFLKIYAAQLEELEKLNLLHETIFVLNNSVDGSHQIVEDFLKKNNELYAMQLIESEQGIYNAFLKGIESRSLYGNIAKIDVDTEFDYWTIPLLIFDLINNPGKRVTYAEIMPKEVSPNRFNMSEFYQEFRTERLYYHGRLSLYRENPFNLFPKDILNETGTLVEDMILSCLFAYYYGLDSMGPAKGAVVKSTQPTSFDMSIRKFDRSRSEIDKIESILPHMKVLSSVLKRISTNPSQDSDDKLGRIDPSKKEMWQAYDQLHQAMMRISRFEDGITSEVTEWDRLR